MSSTVTTTVVTILAWAEPLALGFIATLTLIAFLVTKELAGASEKAGLRFLTRALNVAIFPLLIAFAVTVGVRALEALS